MYGDSGGGGGRWRRWWFMVVVVVGCDGCVLITTIYITHMPDGKINRQIESDVHKNVIYWY